MLTRTVTAGMISKILVVNLPFFFIKIFLKNFLAIVAKVSSRAIIHGAKLKKKSVTTESLSRTEYFFFNGSSRKPEAFSSGSTSPLRPRVTSFQTPLMVIFFGTASAAKPINKTFSNTNSTLQPPVTLTHFMPWFLSSIAIIFCVTIVQYVSRSSSNRWHYLFIPMAVLAWLDLYINLDKTTAEYIHWIVRFSEIWFICCFGQDRFKNTKNLKAQYLTGVLVLGMILAYVVTKTIEPENDNQGKAWVCYLPPSLAMSLSLCSAYAYSQSLGPSEEPNT